MVSLQAKYGMKRLAKVEKTIEEKLKKQTKRHNKSYQVKWYIPIPNDCLYCKIKRLFLVLYAAKFLLHIIDFAHTPLNTPTQITVRQNGESAP